MRNDEILVDVKYQLGTGFTQQLSRSAEVQASHSERFSDARPGQLVNITDFWQAAIGYGPTRVLT